MSGGHCVRIRKEIRGPVQQNGVNFQGRAEKFAAANFERLAASLTLRKNKERKE